MIFHTLLCQIYGFGEERVDLIKIMAVHLHTTTFAVLQTEAQDLFMTDLGTDQLPIYKLGLESAI
jgi:hypothetical protein